MSIYHDLSKRKLEFQSKQYHFFDIKTVTDAVQTDLNHLPYTIRILLESLLRQVNDETITDEDIRTLACWEQQKKSVEIPFKPSRVILQDFTGVPAVVDLAAMREAMIALGGDAAQINPEIPVDLVIDHSVQVDQYGCSEALNINMQKEFERNQERYAFLKWAQSAFSNFRVVPPATGIIHQVNIEYLSDVVNSSENQAGEAYLYPDTVVGTDSHTTMINGIGVLGWGVGGIEAEACMLGEPSYFPLPEVVGVHLTGKLGPGITATDLALKVTQVLRAEGVVGKFVEYFGEGAMALTLSDRATVANMAPEYGATCGFFPIDEETMRYMRLTGRADDQVALAEAYLRENNLFYSSDQQVVYSKVITIDLDSIETNLAGPKRPQDLIPLSKMKPAFEEAVQAPEGNQGFGSTQEELSKQAEVVLDGKTYTLETGSVVIASITSCTNTSNPSVMLAAALLARNAVEKGLTVAPTVKTSLAPGSRAVTGYLEDSKLLPYLEQLGFDVVGYGCATCIGNSGPLRPELEKAIRENDLLVSSVLSGNRNFEGRIHPLSKANYLASPPLVVAYALAGSVNLDLSVEPLGYDENQKPIYLKDIWPSAEEIEKYVHQYVTPELYQKYYAEVFAANDVWNQIETSQDPVYHWDKQSTYIADPPYFTDMQVTTRTMKKLCNLRALAKFGDSVTTDHISPAGAIQPGTPAGKYLERHGLKPEDYNSFGSRRGNHEVMMRGTFGNIRIRNQIANGKEGGYTTYWPTGELTSIYDAAIEYQKQEIGLVVLAGRDYGMGSSRDWAAKGPQLLGVQAVIAKSYERIHRSNLVMMGILPLQFLEGEDADTLGLTGEEMFTIFLSDETESNSKINVVASRSDGTEIHFVVLVRFDGEADIRYYRNEGILPMVIRSKAAKND